MTEADQFIELLMKESPQRQVAVLKALAEFAIEDNMLDDALIEAGCSPEDVRRLVPFLCGGDEVCEPMTPEARLLTHTEIARKAAEMLGEAIPRVLRDPEPRHFDVGHGFIHRRGSIMRIFRSDSLGFALSQDTGGQTVFCTAEDLDRLLDSGDWKRMSGEGFAPFQARQMSGEWPKAEIAGYSWDEGSFKWVPTVPAYEDGWCSQRSCGGSSWSQEADGTLVHTSYVGDASRCISSARTVMTLAPTAEFVRDIVQDGRK